MATQSQHAELKELIKIKFQAVEQKIDQNRELVDLRFATLKKDICELKDHVKETNGNVKGNSHDITVLQEQQKQDERARKRVGTLSWGVLGTVISAGVVWIFHKLFGGQ